jgi:hypothetical protein
VRKIKKKKVKIYTTIGNIDTKIALPLGQAKKRRTFLDDSAGEKRTIFARNDTFFSSLNGPVFASRAHLGLPPPASTRGEAQWAPAVRVWDIRSWVDKIKNFG